MILLDPTTVPFLTLSVSLPENVFLLSLGVTAALGYLSLGLLLLASLSEWLFGRAVPSSEPPESSFDRLHQALWREAFSPGWLWAAGRTVLFVAAIYFACRLQGDIFLALTLGGFAISFLLVQCLAGLDKKRGKE